MQRSGVERLDTSGELDVKLGGKEMENRPEASNMMVLFERMLQEQHSMSEIAVAVEQLVQRNGQFNGKDVSGIFGTTRRRCYGAEYWKDCK
jgi:hypothetical protein